MSRILVTGGTVFVSKYVANYFKKNNDVYVLNRNTRRQPDGVTLIEADRHDLKDVLKKYCFDAVIDVCAYNGMDIDDLLDGLGEMKDYIFISSSAVYPETNERPFGEEQRIGENAVWGRYGTDKIEAEHRLLSRLPDAYILRPPYLYGPMQNLYREPFVFDCALQGRKFYIPKDGSMKLQFFHVEDLCRMIQAILDKHPDDHIFNVGNEEPIDINTFVALCYKAAGKPLRTVNVYRHENQRDYFCFHDYEYVLDVTKQKAILPDTKSMEEGLRESFAWYEKHPQDVRKKGYMEFIDSQLKRRGT